MRCQNQNQLQCCYHKSSLVTDIFIPVTKTVFSVISISSFIAAQQYLNRMPAAWEISGNSSFEAFVEIFYIGHPDDTTVEPMLQHVFYLVQDKRKLTSYYNKP